MLLAFNGWRPGMLLNTWQCVGQFLTIKNYMPHNVSSTKVEKPWRKMIAFMFSFFKLIFYFEIFVDSLAVGRNNTEWSNVPFSQIFPVVTSCTTTVQYHKHNTDVDIVKMQNISITTRIPHLPFYSHSHFPCPPPCFKFWDTCNFFVAIKVTEYQ